MDFKAYFAVEALINDSSDDDVHPRIWFILIITNLIIFQFYLSESKFRCLFYIHKS